MSEPSPTRDLQDSLRITEIFYSLQGESSHAGRPCTFVRLSRCNLRCTWCDTPYSFTGGDRMSIDEILEVVEEHGCDLVEVTGGEPLLQPPVHDLMTTLCDRGYEVLIETSGSLDIAPIDDRVHVIMDLKAPGSGEVERNRYENLTHLRSKDELKFVLLDRADFDWALEIIDEYDLTNGPAPIIFSPVHGTLDPAELAGWILEAGVPVRLGVQLHKYLSLP
jgi:7-carboxy-7-deazaguanine synthase